MAATYFDRFVLAGGFMMIILIPASLLALMWGIQCVIRLRASRVAPASLLAAARQVPDAKGAEDFIAMLATHPSPLARLTLCLLRSQRISDVISHHRDEDFQAALGDEMEFLRKETGGLAGIYKVVPAIGLLGTVIGLMRTFNDFVANPSRTFESLIAGIGNDLVPILWGLAIAIPAFLFVQYARSRIFAYDKIILPGRARELALLLWKKTPKMDRAGY
jgi:biopolymer transport protein ExbB